MAAPSERILIAGAAGKIETAIDFPAAEAAAAGLALVAHPHPLYGGTLDNKVAQTLAKTFTELGYIALRPNFRGVGESEGEHDQGIGETDDMERIAAWAEQRFGALPLVLAGFSFGCHVQMRLAKRLAPGRIARLVLVAPATGKVSADRVYTAEDVPADTIVIHGEQDETVPLANVFDWARPQELPITVIPGADHFFHRRLHLIKAIIKRQWQ
jgi:alpha/beta superfamily hydrolase